MMYAQIDVVGTDRRPAFGQLRRCGREPGERPGPDHRRAQGPGRPRPRSRASMTRSWRSTDGGAGRDRRLPFDEEDYRGETGVPALVGEPGYSTLERRSTRPTLDVNGIWGGFQGEGTKTIIPAHAHAKVSCRLVADQDPDRHLRALRVYVDADRAARRRRRRSRCWARPAEPDPDRPPGIQAARAGRSRRCSAGRRCTSARAARSRSRASFAAILGLPVVLLGLHPARRQGPRAERMDGPRQLRRRASGPSPRPSTRSPHSADATGSGRRAADERGRCAGG